MPARVVDTVGHAAVVLAAVAAAAGLVLVVIGPVSAVLLVTAVLSALYLPVVLVGSALVRRYPRNPVGWLFLLSGAGVPVSTALLAGASVAAVRGGPDPDWLALGGNQLLIGFYPLVTLGLLLFPDGHLHGRRRRWLAGVDVVWLVLLWLWTTFTIADFSTVPGVENPLGIGGPFELGVAVILLAGPVVALNSWAVWRAARSRPDRAGRGMRLIAVAGWGVAASFGTCVAVGIVGGPIEVVSMLELGTLLAVGLGAWVAITRYGLYDMRSVVSRSLTYTVVVVVLAATYVGAVLLVQLLLSPLTDRQGGVSVAVSTLLVAALFRPVRRQVQTAVDRRFHRSRYDARRTVEEFAVRARDGVALTALESDLATVVAGALQPSSASVWMLPVRTGASRAPRGARG